VHRYPSVAEKQLLVVGYWFLDYWEPVARHIIKSPREAIPYFPKPPAFLPMNILLSHIITIVPPAVGGTVSVESQF